MNATDPLLGLAGRGKGKGGDIYGLIWANATREKRAGNGLPGGSAWRKRETKERALGQDLR